jgi:hypothetical protein
MAISPEDFEAYQQVKPVIRSLAAFTLVLRFGLSSSVAFREEKIQDAYAISDLFLAQLEEDMKQ